MQVAGGRWLRPHVQWRPCFWRGYIGLGWHLQEREDAVKRLQSAAEEAQKAAQAQSRTQKDENFALAKQFQDLQDMRARNAREFEHREAALVEQARLSVHSECLHVSALHELLTGAMHDALQCHAWICQPAHSPVMSTVT
jgi:hypothetical protein